jgi:hypothetical protein
MHRNHSGPPTKGDSHPNLAHFRAMIISGSEVIIWARRVDHLIISACRRKWLQTDGLASVASELNQNVSMTISRTEKFRENGRYCSSHIVDSITEGATAAKGARVYMITL